MGTLKFQIRKLYHSISSRSAIVQIVGRGKLDKLLLRSHTIIRSTFELSHVQIIQRHQQQHQKHPATTAAAAAPIMADLPQEVVQEHRHTISNAILAYTALYPGHEWYALVCPCNINCGHMPPEEIPR